MTDRTLAEICTLIVDSEHKTAPKDPEGEHPLIRTTDLGKARADFVGAQRVNADTYSGWTRRAAPRAGDLILAREAPVGGIARVPAGVRPALGQRTVLLRPGDSVDSRFLMYRLAADDAQARMNEMATGSTVPHLNMSDIRSFKLRDLPSIRQQIRRASILAAFDELIAINERRIQLLEDLARSLYREWFMRRTFDARRDRNTSANWTSRPISELAEVISEGVQPSDVPSGTPYCGLEHLPRRATTLQEWGAAESVVSRKLRFRRGDTLFGKIRPYFHKVVWSPFDGVTSSDAIVFRSLDGLSASALLTTILSSDNVVAEAVATSNGTRMPRADAAAILNYRIPLPPPDDALLLRAEAVLRPMYEAAATLASSNRALARARDLLLPRLVTGRLDISDIDLGDLLDSEATS